MNHTTLLVGLVLTLGIPVAATLASFTVNAQQLSTSPSSSIPRTTAISENLKSEMCDPSNPSLKVVNTTEARICNIPKTVKDPTTTATPLSTTTSPTESRPTTQASSSSSPNQIANIDNNNNNNNVISQSNSPAIGASTTQTSSVSNKSPLAPTSSSTPTTTTPAT